MCKDNCERPVSIMAFNANGIDGQIDELEMVLHERNIDILLLNETHLKTKDKFRLKNYHIYRNDRKDGPLGGTAICVKKQIGHRVASIPKLQFIEISGILLPTSNNKEIFIGAIYKSPSKLLTTHDLDIITSISDKFILAGDFNSKHVSWGCLAQNPSGSRLHSYCALHSIEVSSPVEPTFYRSNSSGNFKDILDIVLSKNVNVSPNITVLNEVLDSDHLPIQFQLSSKFIYTPPFRTTSTSTDWNEFSKLTNEMISPKLTIQNTDEIETAIQNFQASIKTAIRIASTSKKQNAYTPNTHTDETLKDLLNHKRKFLKLYRQFGSPCYKTLYNQYTHLVKNRLRELKDEAWDESLSQSVKDRVPPWQLLHRIKASRAPQKTTALCDGQKYVYHPLDKARVLASALEDRFTPHHLASPDHEYQVNLRVETILSSNFPMIMPDIKISELRGLIKNLKSNCAPGTDKIPNIALKHLNRRPLLHLLNIYKYCFKYNYFPEIWKIAKVVMLPKPGKDQSIPNNLRPISLLPSLSKIFERLILEKLKKEISEKHIIPDHQFGFRNSHSTSLQLARLTDLIVSGFNRKRNTVAVFLDIEKAFDTIWINGLIYKLNQINITQSLLKLISSYLINRKFYVTVDGFLSDYKHIHAGVPQGAVLSPLLYNVYVADIPSCKLIQMAQFADDTCIFYQSKHRNIPKTISFLQQAIDQLSDWFARWNIKINAQKTQAIVFSKTGHRVEAPIKIQNCVIPYNTSVKYLGVTLDSKLTFQNHITTIINKAYGALSILYPFFKTRTLSKRTKVILYMTIVRSMLLYGCEAWSILAKCHRKKVQIFQNKCLKIIFEAPRYTRIAELHEVANLTYIADLVEDRVRMMFSNLSMHENPLVQQMGKISHWCAKHRGIFQRVIPEDTGDTVHQSDD